MKPRDAILITIGCVLLLCVSLVGLRVAERARIVRWEPGHVKLMHLSEPTRTALTALKHDVLLTYYVSERWNLPSSMKRIEQDVEDVLRAMARDSAGRLRYQILHPERDPDELDFAARQKVAPYRVRSVMRDSYDEQTVWSALHVAYGPYEPVVINALSNDSLPRLSAVIVEHLHQMVQPRRPVFALAAQSESAGFEGIAQYLMTLGDVLRIDLSHDAPIPAEADVLFWLNPGAITSQSLQELQAFLNRGGSAVIAGGMQTVEVRQPSAPSSAEASRTVSFAFNQIDGGINTLLNAFGVTTVPATVLDDVCLSQQVEGQLLDLKFMVRCIGPNQDFRTMRDQPNGNLLFELPMLMRVDAAAVAARGYSTTTLATTSDRTAFGPKVTGVKSLEELAALPLEPTSKLPLLLWLRPHQAWKGSVVLCASASPFHDRWLAAENYANRRLVDALCRTLASNDRLVVARAGVLEAGILPELSTTARVFWRGVCLGLFPCVLLIAVLIRRRQFRNAYVRTDSRRPLRPEPGLMSHWRPSLITAIGVIAIMCAVGAVGSLNIQRDLTQQQISTLTPHAIELVREATSLQPIDATFYVSRPQDLPPELRPAIRELNESIGLIHVAAALSLRVVHPEDLSSKDRAELTRIGINPFHSTSHDEEITTVRSGYCTLELQIGDSDRRAVLPFDDLKSFEHARFRIAFALWRLQNDKQPHIALATDRPRLSPAEALQDFQQRSLHAPSGTDVYSEVRRTLERLDFRITSVNPQDPVLPDDVDLIIWMQPRRSVHRMLQMTVERLAKGVPVMIAAQHFNIQARQYRTDSFRMVYWPQPQEPDINRVYFPQIGVDLVRDIVFDDRKANLPLETQVNRSSAEREYVQQESALPFFIRVSPDSTTGQSPESMHPLMRGLGDCVMPFASAIKLDHARLDALNLRATTILHTSNRSWPYQWTGGWLPDEILHFDWNDEAQSIQKVGSFPLAVLLEGQFPLPATSMATRPADDVSPVTLVEPPADLPASRLLLLGCSEMFKNDRITHEEFRADHILINAATWLALPPDLAELAMQRQVSPGLPMIDIQQCITWRAAVLLAGPMLMIVFALFWHTIRCSPRVSYLLNNVQITSSTSGGPA